MNSNAKFGLIVALWRIKAHVKRLDYVFECSNLLLKLGGMHSENFLG